MAEMTAQYLSQTDAPDRFDSNYNSNYGSNASFCLPIRSGYGQVAENEFSPSPSSSVLSTEDTSIDIEDCLEDCECKQAERAEQLRAKAVLDARRATRTVDIDVVLRYARLGLCPLPPGTTENLFATSSVEISETRSRSIDTRSSKPRQSTCSTL